jgi:hypothetical protein
MIRFSFEEKNATEFHSGHTGITFQPMRGTFHRTPSLVRLGDSLVRLGDSLVRLGDSLVRLGDALLIFR